MAVYVECRTRMLGHDWDHYGSVPGERKPIRGHVFAHFRCTRCGTVKRYEIHASTGEASKPQYFDRPKDYSLMQLTNNELRRELMRLRKDQGID